MTDATTTPGSVIDGRYRIEAALGEGAAGMVVKATHLEAGTHVAIKFLLPRMQVDPIVVERFAREARAAALITSEHVARVYDVGETRETGPYIVMEYLSGETISDALKRLRMLPVEVACGYMIQICEALTEAHARGIIHRDLKPANLFITNRGGKQIVKVLDFGISKLGGEAIHVGDGELTTASTILGTPLYMAPEQLASSRTVDERADIWSCGVCLHRMLCGLVPFEADSLPALGAKLLTTKAPNLTTLRPTVPRELAAVVLRCLERDVEQRWQSAAELAAALRRFASGARGPSRSEPIEDPHSVPTIAIVPRSEAETSADLSAAAAAARVHIDRARDVSEDTLTKPNGVAPITGQRPSLRPPGPPSMAPPVAIAPAARNAPHPGRPIEEELPTMRLASPPVSPELHLRPSRPPPAAGAPYPGAFPSHPVSVHGGHVRANSGNVMTYPATSPSDAYVMDRASGAPAYPEQASHHPALMAPPPGRNPRNAPTVRGRRRKAGALDELRAHPYFGVGIAFVGAVLVAILMFALVR